MAATLACLPFSTQSSSPTADSTSPFVSATAGDFLPSTGATDPLDLAANLAVDVPSDIDGDARPRGAAFRHRRRRTLPVKPYRGLSSRIVSSSKFADSMISSRTGMSPTRIESSGPTRTESTPMGRSLTNVPFLLPRSLRRQWSPSRCSDACTRETDGSSSTRVQYGLRPITTSVAPRSTDCVSA